MPRFLKSPNANPRWLFIPNKEWARELGGEAYTRELDNYNAIERWSRMDPPYQLIVHTVFPTTGFETDRYYVPEKSVLIKSFCTLSTAGTTTTTIDLHLNGAALSPAVSFSLASGVHVATPKDIVQHVDPKNNDYFTVVHTTMGTDAKGAIVYLIFQPTS